MLPHWFPCFSSLYCTASVLGYKMRLKVKTPKQEVLLVFPTSQSVLLLKLVVSRVTLQFHSPMKLARFVCWLPRMIFLNVSSSWHLLSCNGEALVDETVRQGIKRK